MIHYYAMPGLKYRERLRVPPDRIINRACDYYGVTVAQVHSPSRVEDICECRHVICYLMRKHTSMTFTKIGMMLSRRDHTTVIHAYNSIQNRMSVDKHFRNIVNEIEEGI